MYTIIHYVCTTRTVKRWVVIKTEYIEILWDIVHAQLLTYDVLAVDEGLEAAHDGLVLEREHVLSLDRAVQVVDVFLQQHNLQRTHTAKFILNDVTKGNIS